MRNIVLRAGLAVGLTAAAGGAWATPCDSALSSLEFYYMNGFTSSAAQLISNHPECFSGSPATSRTSIVSTSFAQAAAISNALAMREPIEGPAPSADAGTRGMAAGAVAGKWNVWGNLTNNDTRQSTTTLTGFKSKNSADVLNFIAGVDYNLSPTMVLGVSAAFDDGDGKGRNSNSLDRNTFDSKGYQIAPYFGWQLSKDLYFDASFGLGRGEIDTNTNTESEADRWFGAANLSYNRWYGNFQLTGKASWLHGVEDYGNSEVAGVTFVGTDAKNTLGQIRLGAQAGYWMNGVMPYASLAYTNDVHRKTTQFGSPNNPIGRDAWVWGLGVNFYSVKNKLTGGIAYNQETSRSNQNNYSLMANINFRF